MKCERVTDIINRNKFLNEVETKICVCNGMVADTGRIESNEKGK